MTLSDKEKPAPVWNADPLLKAGASAPRYLQTLWNEKSARTFGPWRVADKADPTDNQTVHHGYTPYSEPSEDASTGPQDEPPPMTEVIETVESRLSESALNVLREEAYQKGVAAGMEQARNELAVERQQERELFRHLSIELRSIHQDTQRLFEPLKRLSLHLAEQLVRGELQVSGHVINDLIQQCLEQLDHPTDKVVVTLHPEDVQRLKAMDASVTTGLELEPDAQMNVGSVRMRVNDTIVQDLIEHRLEPLARRLLSEPDAWIHRSTLLAKEKLDVSEVTVPQRDWGQNRVDVEDSIIKPHKPDSQDDHEL